MSNTYEIREIEPIDIDEFLQQSEITKNVIIARKLNALITEHNNNK